MTEFEVWFMKHQNTNHLRPLQKDQDGFITTLKRG